MASTRSAKELWELYREDAVVEVQRESDSSYRHGTYEYVVVKDADSRYWAGSYTLSGDGEHNEWRDDNEFMEPFHEKFLHKVVREVLSYENEPQMVG